MFPKISKIVGKDPLRPALEHAIIQNGNLVATDSYMLVCIPVSTFIREEVDGDKIYTAEEQIANVEGKMFSVPLIKKLTSSSVSKVIYLEDYIAIFNKKNEQELIRYTGKQVTEEDKKDTKVYKDMESPNYFKFINPIDGSVMMVNEMAKTIHYPRWEGAVPAYNPDMRKLDFAKLIERLPEVKNTICLKPQQLNDMAVALGHEMVAYITSEKGVNYVTGASGKSLEDTILKGFGVIMKVDNSDIKFL